jgi:uncharacterized protein
VAVGHTWLLFLSFFLQPYHRDLALAPSLNCTRTQSNVDGALIADRADSGFDVRGKTYTVFKL